MTQGFPGFYVSNGRAKKSPGAARGFMRKAGERMEVRPRWPAEAHYARPLGYRRSARSYRSD